MGGGGWRNEDVWDRLDVGASTPCRASRIVLAGNQRSDDFSGQSYLQLFHIGIITSEVAEHLAAATNRF